MDTDPCDYLRRNLRPRDSQQAIQFYRPAWPPIEEPPFLHAMDGRVTRARSRRCREKPPKALEARLLDAAAADKDANPLGIGF